METRGLLSRVSVRGILIVTHNEITRTQVEALNSTLWPLTRTIPDNHSPEDGKGVEQIDQGSRAATVEYGSRLERTRRRRAQGRRPPPDACTGTRAFNAPVAFSPNTPVTGSVIGNMHPSRHSFLQPSPLNDPERVRTRGAGMERLIRTPSRHPGSTLWTAKRCTTADPRPDLFPSRGRVGRRMVAKQPLRQIHRCIIPACHQQTSPGRRGE